MSNSWHSYPSLYAMGHRAVRDMLLDPVIVQEKVDGSQFSFGRFGDELRIRSKGVEMNIDAPEKMFAKAADTVKSIGHLLVDGWTYRGEYLQKPKHNTLAYDRVPNGHIILFDISTGLEEYASYETVGLEAERLGLEAVPLVYEGMIDSAEVFMAMLERTSVLGGQKVEGVVVKNYARFGMDKKPLFAKFVSEAFKEIHQGEWKKANPGSTDIIEAITAAVRTPARWNKAVQHLREAGTLEGSPRDIGNLIKEVQRDLDGEMREEITDRLLDWALPKVLRGCIVGLPEWYKEQLVQQQFQEEEPNV